MGKGPGIPGGVRHRRALAGGGSANLSAHPPVLTRTCSQSGLYCSGKQRATRTGVSAESESALPTAAAAGQTAHDR